MSGVRRVTALSGGVVQAVQARDKTQGSQGYEDDRDYPERGTPVDDAECGKEEDDHHDRLVVLRLGRWDGHALLLARVAVVWMRHTDSCSGRQRGLARR